MSNVLVTAIGSFSADIVIKTLKGRKDFVVGCDIYDKEWIADAQNVDKFYKAPYAVDSDKYISFVSEVCRDNNIDYILPLTDVELDILNERRDELRENNVCLCISDYETIKICRNKYQLYNFLKEKKVTGLISTSLLSNINIDDIEFPAVVKPYDGRSSQGLFVFHKKKELKSFVENNDVSRYIIQPMKTGNIVTVDVVRRKEQGLTVTIPRRELLRTPNGAGTSICVFSHRSLQEQAVRLAELLDIKGCVNFEFIEDTEGNYYFLECNPRFSGGVEFSCMAGYDCIMNHMRCFDGTDIECENKITQMYIARKYEEYVTKVCVDNE